MSVENTLIEEYDLRRALLSYLIGLWLFSYCGITVVLGYLLSFADGNLPTFSVWKGVLFTVSVSVMLLSQVWYFRTKHIWRDSQSYTDLIKRASPEFVLLVLSVSLVFAMYFGIIGGEAIATGFILLVLPVLIYYLILVFWNVTRFLNKRYPDMDPYTRGTLILLFGSVLSGVFLLITLSVLL